MSNALTTSMTAPTGEIECAVELHLVANVCMRPSGSVAGRRLMRTIDVVGALCLLVIVSPVLAVVALLVKRSGPGPIIFRQDRIGSSGEPFRMLKFRSMADGTHLEVLNDAELRRQYEQNEFKLAADDPRITPLGRVIRRSSLDELPQLWNVLRGEMSLVGVRPIEAGQLAMRSRYDQELYSSHRPGLTGLWQVEGRSSIGDDHRVELDRRFLTDWSPRQNLALLMRTPRVVLRGAGAH